MSRRTASSTTRWASRPYCLPGITILQYLPPAAPASVLARFAACRRREYGRLFLLNGMRGLARRVSKIVGVDVAEVLTGRFPPKGTCRHCGRYADATETR